METKEDAVKRSWLQSGRRSRHGMATCLLVIGFGAGWPGSGVRAADWPNWRGPELTGASRETALPSTWSLLWQAPYGGRSTPVVHRGKLFVVNKAGSGVHEQERIMALDAATGQVLWEHRFNVFLTDIPSARVGWASPVVDPETGYVYAHGVQNTFVCLDDEGKVIWTRYLHEEYGTINGYGGRTHTPVIDEERVIISFLNSSWGPHARGLHRYVAFDKRTGSVVWWSEPGGPPLDTTYSMPTIAVVDGVRMLIGGNADGGIYGLAARTGEKLWSFQLSKRGINSSVVVWNNRVYACHSEDNIDEPTMGRIVCIDATGRGDVTKTHEKWRYALTAGYASPAIAGGRVYVTDNSAELVCLDAESGREMWTHRVGTAMRGSPVAADGKVYITEWNGNFLILESGEKECKELLKKHFGTADGTVLKTAGSPAIANGRVYFNTADALYCIGEENWSGKSGALPEPPKEKDGGATAAHLQITPADVVLHPGQSVAFRSQAFNSSGQLIGVVEPEWSLEGFAGEVSTSGRLTVSDEIHFAQGALVASYRGVSQRARVRVLSRVPFSEDFETTPPGRPPASWVGAGIKFVGGTYKGDKVLTKVGENPKFMDGETFFGLPEWSNYTLESDVLATEKKFSLPNIGILNSRYNLALMGNHQRLRIFSWVPQPRIDKTIRFKWDADVWYRMKLRVSVRDGVGLAQGKVWRREEPEPDEWLIELEDPNPNRGGSPGFYGYSYGVTDKSPGAGIFYDNVKVSWN